MMTFLAWFSQILLLLLGLFLIIVVLLQRGRGGGLAGAFGGTGGQSAFGTKAGDVFTRITIVLAILWVVVSGGSGFFLRAAANQKAGQFPDQPPAATVNDPAIPSKPDAGTVPANPEPPAGKGTDASAAPTGAATPEASSTAAPTTTEPESTEPAAATPASADAATPAPDGDAPGQN